MKMIILSILLLIGFMPLHSDELVDSYGATPGSRVRKANGHSRDKDKILSGDVINGLYGRGFNGSAFTSSDNVSVEMQAAENWSTTANGTKILFKTTPAGSVTIATVGTFQPDGGFLPYSRTEAQLKVSTPTAVGALYHDSTNNETVRSTGTTTCFDYAKIEDPAAAPDGW